MTKTTIFTISVIVTSLIAISAIPSSYAIIVGGVVENQTWDPYNRNGGTSLAAGGTFVEDPYPILQVGEDNHESHNLFAFNEGQNLYTSVPVSVDILSTGGSGDLPVGTYASHYVFYDPPAPGINTIEGCVEFDSPVLGVATSKVNLDASDAFQATEVTGAEYLSPSLRGLESNDRVSIQDTNKVCVSFYAGSPGDYIRVLTNFTPEVTFDGKGQRSDVNQFLQFASPLQSTNQLDANTDSYVMVIRYGETTDEGSFSAILNGLDISSSFNPVPGTFEIVEIQNLEPGRNTLKLSIDGDRTDGRTATDTDRLVFLVP